MSYNLSYLEQESKRVSSEQKEYIAIVSDRYEQEMRKAVRNIQYEVENAESPYSGKDLAPVIDESLATIDLAEPILSDLSGKK